MITLAYCPRCEKWNSIDYMVAVKDDSDGDDALVSVCRRTCLREGEESGTLAVISYQAEEELEDA